MTIPELLMVFVNWMVEESLKKMKVESGGWVNAGNLSLHVDVDRASRKEHLKLHSYGYCMAQAVFSTSDPQTREAGLKFIVYKPVEASVTTRKHITQLEKTLLSTGTSYIVKAMP